MNLKISLNIIAVFIIVILGSFIPEMFPQFFGDWFCDGWIEKWDWSGGHSKFLYQKGNCSYIDHYHSPEWHWGYRHWMFFLMGLCLFLVQVNRIISIIYKSINN